MARFGGVFLLLVVMALAGCGDRLPAGTDLEFYAKDLPTMNAVYDKFDLAHIGSGVQEDGVHLEVRKRHDPMKKTPENEIERIKNAIYEEVGSKFPLQIDVWTMPEIPTVDGKITAMDDRGILVVAPPADADSSPRAMWLRSGPDTVILKVTEEEDMGVDQLAIGYRVRAWSEPLVLTSYPEQSGLLRLEVTDTDIGNGDLQGTVTKKGIGVEDTTERELQIDGKPYRVFKSTVFRIGEAKASFEDMKEGDRVTVWFTGYELMPGDKVITQVLVTPSP